MFLHLGSGVVIPLSELIAIINLDSAQHCKVTREFLSFAVEENPVVRIGADERRKSMILTTRRLIFSPISSLTLLKRAQLGRLVKTGCNLRPAKKEHTF